MEETNYQEINDQRIVMSECCSAKSANDDYSKNDSEKDYLCGLFNYRPKWIQRFAKKQILLLVICLTSVLQLMYYTYIVSMLSTIEKLYKLSSRTTGFIISSCEFGQIIGSLILSYLGNKCNRPKLIGFSVLIFSLANFLFTSPHFLFSNKLETQTLLSLKQTDNDLNLLHENYSEIEFNSSIFFNQNLNFSLKNNLCLDLKNLKKKFYKNVNYFKNDLDIFENYLNQSFNLNRCDDKLEKENQNKVSYLVICIFFISSTLVGFGTTAVNTLGIPYIDDNIAQKESPLYFAITIGIRIFGPVLGFLLGSLCSRIYVNFPLNNENSLNLSHPQWLGAWWLGFLILGFLMVFNSLFVMCFPKKLPSNSKKKKPKTFFLESNQTGLDCDEDNLNCYYNKSDLIETSQNFSTNLKNNTSNIIDSQSQCCKASFISQGELNTIKEDFKIVEQRDKEENYIIKVRSMLKNKVLIFRMLSTVFHILPISGLYTFLPKYLEYQFQITASEASFLSGVSGILVMGFGIFFSGVAMHKFNLNPKFVSLWIACATLIYVCGMILLMFLGCSMPTIVGLNYQQDSVIQNDNDDLCTMCNCKTSQFSPVCASDSKTYLSPCLAGCKKLNISNKGHDYFDCGCLDKKIEIVKNGFCDLKCKNYTIYIILFSILAFFHSTTEVGAMLLNLRCIKRDDKVIALGLITFMACLFGSLPCPIIYGIIIDSSCVFWHKDCNSNGACRLFDMKKFRYYFHGLTAFFMFIAFITDLFVYFLSDRISFIEEIANEPKTESSNCQIATLNVNTSNDNNENSMSSSTNLKSSNI